MLEQFNDVDSLWQNVLSKARIYAESNEVYFSPIQEVPYRVVKVENDVIHLLRQKAKTTIPLEEDCLILLSKE
ncbi:hypothetical protein [Candidatus Pollutiaquabacter sp.]|uniref:hypothetical protein n=1 Tax=Candidatus Pollutiaquabacter sp. TaxID=3416354 RepID=UPI003C9C96AF|nr:hypothetical protein [Bacteroidota bacterium]